MPSSACARACRMLPTPLGSAPWNESLMIYELDTNPKLFDNFRSSQCFLDNQSVHCLHESFMISALPSNVLHYKRASTNDVRSAVSQGHSASSVEYHYQSVSHGNNGGSPVQSYSTVWLCMLLLYEDSAGGLLSRFVTH